MFCKNCGAKLEEGSVFCPMCGTNNAQDAAGETQDNVSAAQQPQENVSAQPQENTEVNADADNNAAESQTVAGNNAQPVNNTTVQDNPNPAPEQQAQKADAGSKIADSVKKFGAKKIGIIAAVIVVVIILIAAFSGGSSKVVSIDKKSATSVGNGYFIDANGNTKEFDDVYSVYTSSDLSVTLYTDYDGDLYVVDDKLGTEKIGSDVTTVRVGVTGEYVAYLENEDDEYYNQTLYIYNVSKKKSNKIDTDVSGDYLTISTNGQSVAYEKDYDNGEFDTYVAGYAKDPEKIAKTDARPVAVSDNGKKAYYIDQDRTLYYFNGKDKSKVTSDVGYTFWANSDLSEFLFAKDGDTYFCKPGKDEEKLGKSEIYSVIYPQNCYASYIGDSTVALLNDTIKGQVVYCGDGRLYWVNKKATEMVKIDSSVSSVLMSDDGASIVYVSNEKVYKVNKFKEDMDPELLFDEEDVYSVVASSDLKKVYAFSYDEQSLYYIKNSKKAVTISDEAESAAFNNVDGKVYFIADGELYEAKTSDSSKKKVSIDGDAYSVSSSTKGVMAFAEDGGDYTCYAIGKKLVTVYED